MRANRPTASPATNTCARYYNPGLGRFLSADSVQPNAPGTQGYNRYAYAANNPTIWTDPSGHTIDDVQQGIKVINTLVNAVKVLGAALVALLPIMLLNPFAGLALGIVFYMAFFTLGLLLLQSIGDVLALLTDQFDHYDGNAPQVTASDTDPAQLPVNPANCSLTREQLLKVVSADGRVDASERGMLTDCGVTAETANTLSLLADWVTFLINMVEVGWIGLMTVAGCFEGMTIGLPLLGRGAGFTQGYTQGFVAGTIAAYMIGMVPVLDRCIEGHNAYSDECSVEGIRDVLASRIPGLFFNLA